MTELVDLPKGLVFVDQYNRMRRWYERFQKINEGTPVSKGHALYEKDEILVFFIICYHLSDWIIQDVFVERNHPNRNKFQKLEHEVHEFIKKNDCLSLCADICNSAKHQRLVKPPHFREKTEIPHPTFKIIKTKTGELLKQNWEIVSTESDKKFALFEIATECVNKWDEFLEIHGSQIEELTPYWRKAHETVSYDPKNVEGNVIGSEHIKVHRVRPNTNRKSVRPENMDK
jgi:hypothetical protein